jgi:hypothetical protein
MLYFIKKIHVVLLMDQFGGGLPKPMFHFVSMKYIQNALLCAICQNWGFEGFH